MIYKNKKYENEKIMSFEDLKDDLKDDSVEKEEKEQTRWNEVCNLSYHRVAYVDIVVDSVCVGGFQIFLLYKL
jgi:hypothetical protein